MRAFSLNRLSLRAVVIGSVIVGLTVPISLGMLYSLSTQHDQLVAEAKAAHSRTANIIALGVMKAIWDFAVEQAKPLTRSVMEDTRVVRVSIYDNNSKPFYEQKDESRRIGNVLSLDRPVVKDDQEIGHVTVEFSMAQADAQIRERSLDVIVLSLIQALACIGILFVLINRRIIARISRLKDQASKMADKKLDEPFVWKEGDEINTLGLALETTRQALQSLFSEIEQKNADLKKLNSSLEVLVAERTATIKMILDHVRSGFLLVNRKLKIQDGYTRSCETLLGSNRLEKTPLPSVLGLKDSAAENFQALCDLVFEDLMPEDVALEQIPHRFVIGDRTVAIEGSTVRSANQSVESVLFTIVDITELDVVERENRVNRAMIRILQNTEAFKNFISETARRIESCHSALLTSNQSLVRHELHTLKGNCSAFGLDEIARSIHQIEDQSEVTKDQIDHIEKSFRSFLDRNSGLLHMKFDGRQEEHFTIKEQQIEGISKNMERVQSLAELKHLVNSWLHDVQKVSLNELLGPMSSYIEKLASQRYRKIEFRVLGGDVLVEKNLLRDVTQNLIHLVRNAIDHGIEPAAERGNKGEKGVIEFSFHEVGDKFQIVVKDDGRGIDTKKVIAKAIDLGHLNQEQAKRLSHKEALMLVFNDGLSTADRISDTAGRGVGMPSVKEAVEKIGGQISIDSELGKGTTITITLPRT